MTDIERDVKGDEEKPRVIRLQGTFSDPEGNLRRGAPIWVVGEDGEKTPAFREHNTGKIFPREVIATDGQSSGAESPSTKD